MSAAVAAAAAWRQVPAPKRGEAVRLMGEELRRYKDALGSLVSMENGKIKAEGDGEVQEMIDIADFAVGQSRMLYGLTMHSERPQHRMYEQWHPLGVVGRDFRVQFPGGGVVLECVPGGDHRQCHGVEALAQDRAVLARRAAHLQSSAGAPRAAADIPDLHRRRHRTCAMRFVDDRRVALVSFTGSTHVGRQIGVRVAERLGKSLLELGGNNAIIVDDSANLDLAVPGIVFGAVGTAGQRCTTTRRVLVHRSRAAELERRLVAAYAQVRIGDPLERRHPDGTPDRCRRGVALFRGDRRGAGRRRTSCCAAARCWRGPAISSSRPSFAPMPAWRWCAPKPLRRFCT